jgi:hypothetical protein
VLVESAREELLGMSTRKVGWGGNRVLPKIGKGESFRGVGETATFKEIDPSHLVRSLPANASV